MKKTIWCLAISIVCWLTVSCTSRPENPVAVNDMPNIYPDYKGVTIPAEIAPLNFNMATDDADMVDVSVRGSKGGTGDTASMHKLRSGHL